MISMKLSTFCFVLFCFSAPASEMYLLLPVLSDALEQSASVEDKVGMTAMRDVFYIPVPSRTVPALNQFTFCN